MSRTVDVFVRYRFSYLSTQIRKTELFFTAFNLKIFTKYLDRRPKFALEVKSPAEVSTSVN